MGERVNVLGIEIELERVEKVLRVFYFLRPLDQRSQRLQRLIVVARAAFTFLVFPVRRDAFLGDLMHLLGANLTSNDCRFEPITEVCSDWYRLSRGVAIQSLMRPGTGFQLLWTTPSAA